MPKGPKGPGADADSFLSGPMSSAGLDMSALPDAPTPPPPSEGGCTVLLGSRALLLYRVAFMQNACQRCLPTSFTSRTAVAAECQRAMMTMTLFYVIMLFTVIAGLVYCARRRTAIRQGSCLNSSVATAST